jgi:hypothetical protein
MIYKTDLHKNNSLSDNEISYDVNDKNLADREIVLPGLNSKFAEFMGALAGDGHLSATHDIYRVEITLDGREDRYYARFIARCFQDLFGLSPRLNWRNDQNCVQVMVHSKKVHKFLSQSFVVGKKDSLWVPNWIDSEKEISAYLRGLIDTDGSLFFAKRGMYERNSYPVIELKMEDCGFLDEVEDLLETLDIEFYRASYNKIQLNGEKKLKKWMSKVGFSNPSRSSRYAVWKVQNYCPPDTSLDQRLEILKDL